MVYFKINSKSLTRNPTAIEHGKQIIQNSDRTIDGTLAVDIIAVKNKITVTWSYMTGADFNKLTAELNQPSFQTIECYDANNILRTFTVSLSDLTYSPHYFSPTLGLIWKDVRATFIEV